MAPLDPPVTHTEGTLRRLLYGIIGAAGWIGFGWAWYVVFYKRTPDQTLRGLLALLIFLVFVVVITLAWMRHNVALSRRKTPRTQVPYVKEDYSRDHFGRAVHAEWAAVREAGMVTIDYDDASKTYVTGGASS